MMTYLMKRPTIWQQQQQQQQRGRLVVALYLIIASANVRRAYKYIYPVREGSLSCSLGRKMESKYSDKQDDAKSIGPVSAGSLPDYQLVDGYRVPAAFSSEAVRSAYLYRAKEDDFFMACFPKSGSTWAQMIIYLIYKNGVPVQDCNSFLKLNPLLELTGADWVDQMAKPGCIKTHLARHKVLFSDKAKYVHLVRNPKDLCVSFFYHTRSPAYDYRHGTFDQFFELFINGQTDFGNWFDHVLGWYQHRHDPNVLLLTFEELKRETKQTILKVAQFMGEEYLGNLEKDPNLINKIMKFSSLEHMKVVINDLSDSMIDFCIAKPDDLEDLTISDGMKHFWKYISKHDAPDATQRFHIIRKGIVGDWRNLFSEDQARRMDQEIEERLKGTDLYTYWKGIGCI